ncbi:hypothetical protein WJX81_006249 [Elliptochloris bilobata]|uniref:uridine/cytidine kinase n=1 Tax=Elliptochloris bilobata TaxID=381761 RepID=A0AAW1QLA7_9CHLO
MSHQTRQLIVPRWQRELLRLFLTFFAAALVMSLFIFQLHYPDARHLQKTFVKLDHRKLLHVAQDSFYRNLTAAEARDIASFNFDHTSAFAYDEIYATLHALKSGRSAVVPIYDFVTSSRQHGGTLVGNAGVVLFDGILALHYPELRSLFDFKVFVDTDADTRLARRIRRDVMDRGRDVLAVLAQYERTVKPSFEEWILPTRKFADIIVPRGAENTAAIDILFQHIRYQLAERGQALPA